MHNPFADIVEFILSLKDGENRVILISLIVFFAVLILVYMLLSR